jgi:hypothetical protein
MALFENRTIFLMKNIVYLTVKQRVNACFARLESFKNAISSAQTPNDRCKPFGNDRERLCIVTILNTNGLQKDANDFETIFSSLIRWLPVLYRAVRQSFAVRLIVKRSIGYLKPLFALKTGI